MNNNENKPKSHPHAELIKAWADGATIQYRPNDEMDWEDCDPKPEWHAFHQYRIKPEEHKPWKPEFGEEYYHINVDDYGRVLPQSYLWTGNDIDNRLWEFGNCFRTIKEAEAAIPRMERALKNLYAISDKKAHDLECELYDKIDRLTKYPEIDGKPLTEGEIALIKALRISKIYHVCESATVAIEGHNDINGAKLVQNAFSFVPASKHHYAELSVAIKQIKSEQESTK